MLYYLYIKYKIIKLNLNYINNLYLYLFIFYKKKLEIFQKYFKENLEKIFMKKSQLIIKYLIFFIF